MHRALFLILFILALAVPAVLAQDPVKVDSKHQRISNPRFAISLSRILTWTILRPCPSSSIISMPR